MKSTAVAATTCCPLQAVLKIPPPLPHVKVLLVAIRDFFVCGVAAFFDNSENGYGLFFQMPTIILFYLCHKDLLFFLLDNTPKFF
jgi:hypothetical protein